MTKRQVYPKRKRTKTGPNEKRKRRTGGHDLKLRAEETRSSQNFFKSKLRTECTESRALGGRVCVVKTYKNRFIRAIDKTAKKVQDTAGKAQRYRKREGISTHGNYQQKCLSSSKKDTHRYTHGQDKRCFTEKEGMASFLTWKDLQH